MRERNKSMISKLHKIDNINYIRQWAGGILILSCVIEVMTFPSMENIYACIALFYGWFLISKVVINHDNFKKYILPTLTLLGYGFCYCILPIVVTLIEGKPITFNFQLPYLTFTNQIISISVIVAAYKVCIKIYKPQNWLNTLWNKIGYMTPPSELQIWVMGIVGLFALLSRMSHMGEEIIYRDTGNVVSIFINVLSGFSLAPVCLYFNNVYGDFHKIQSRSFVKYYIMILMVLGAATTRRELIFNSISVIIGVYVFILIFHNKVLFTKRNAILFFIIFYFITGPAADMAMAMILNRHTKVNAEKSFSKVIETFQDKEKLHSEYQLFMQMTDNEGDNAEGWSEYYVDNIFLDRLCNLRTIDATLYNASKVGFDSKQGKDYYMNFWINEMPSPITNAIKLKKSFIGTAVDHMLVHNFGERYSLLGCKVGGETGIGLWMFGYWYYLLAFCTYVIIFYFLCSFVNIKNGILLLPIPILMKFNIFWMFFINANGIFSSMGYVFTRKNLNIILIYCVFFFILRVLFKNKKYENSNN